MSEAENKREYEMSFLLTPEVSEDRLDFESAELKKIISENGGINVEINPLENKRLAYPVKKQKSAYLGVIYFSIDPEGLDKMKDILTLNTKILRFLILNKPNKPVKSKVDPIMRIPEAIPLPIILPRKEMAAEIPTESFDKKLESILKG